MPLLGFRFELVPKGIHAFIQMAIAAALYDLLMKTMAEITLLYLFNVTGFPAFINSSFSWSIES